MSKQSLFHFGDGIIVVVQKRLHHVVTLAIGRDSVDGDFTIYDSND
jgi:hypothetical protein